MTQLKFFYIILTVIIFQRVVELYIARNNAQYMRSLGGFEVAAEHYKYIFMLHTGFFIGILTEVVMFKSTMPSWWKLTFGIFILTQVMRVWCIKSLGRFWNTRIYVVPSAAVIRNGPYRFLRHPNYLVVITELLVIPLTFGAYYTAASASIINLALLYIRINKEESALAALTGYREDMKTVPRLIPFVKRK